MCGEDFQKSISGVSNRWVRSIGKTLLKMRLKVQLDGVTDICIARANQTRFKDVSEARTLQVNSF